MQNMKKPRPSRHPDGATEESFTAYSQSVPAVKVAEHEARERRERAGHLAAFVAGHLSVTELLARRALTEAIAAALPATWERRADAYEWACPTEAEMLAGDPEATARLGAKRAELESLAEVCRLHAAFLRANPPQWLESLAEAMHDDEDGLEVVVA